MAKVTELQGWDKLDLDNPVIQQQRENLTAQAKSIAELFSSCFRTDAGKAVLDILVKQTIMRPVVTNNATQFQAGIREGQNDLVRQILANIELANAG